MNLEEMARRVLDGGLLKVADLAEAASRRRVATGMAERFDILDRLGGGTSGDVFRARQRATGQTVAIKRVRLYGRTPGDSDAMRARFERETAALVRLRHPGIPRVIESAFEDGWGYLAMELIEGTPLDRAMEDPTHEPAERVRWVEEAARIVQVAHDHGYVHRDLKPANIVLDRGGSIHVLDFGLAKDLSDEAGVTGTVALLGTPYYMSPEQAQGRSREVDARSDVFSLGAILYHSLTGRPPFEGATVTAVIDAVARATPIVRGPAIAALPAGLDGVLVRALDLDPSRRYGTAEGLAADLRSWRLRGRPLAGPHPRRRRLAALLVPAGLAVLLGIVVGHVSRPGRSGPSPAPPAPKETARPDALADVEAAIESWGRERPIAGGALDFAGIEDALADLDRLLPSTEEGMKHRVLSLAGRAMALHGRPGEALERYAEAIASAEPYPDPGDLVDRADAAWDRLAADRVWLPRRSIAEGLARMGCDRLLPGAEPAAWLWQSIEGPTVPAADLMERAEALAAEHPARGPTILRHLGDLLLLGGEAEAASGAYERALQSMPNCPFALAGLALAMAACGHPETARDMANGAFALDPGNAAAAVALLQTHAPVLEAIEGGERRSLAMDLQERLVRGQEANPTDTSLRVLVAEARLCVYETGALAEAEGDEAIENALGLRTVPVDRPGGRRALRTAGHALLLRARRLGAAEAGAFAEQAVDRLGAWLDLVPDDAEARTWQEEAQTLTRPRQED